MKQPFSWTVMMLAAQVAQAQDRADLDRTAIIGNGELPKVTYIVPWKKPLPGEGAGVPVGGVLDEALAPLDREVFRRQIAFDAQLRDRANAAATTTDAATATRNPPPEKKP